MDRDVLLFLIGVLIGVWLCFLIFYEPKEELKPTLEELK